MEVGANHPPPVMPHVAGNSTRLRVLVGKEDSGGEFFTVELLIRPTAFGAVRGAWLDECSSCTECGVTWRPSTTHPT
jgi:hypothetical protein